MQKDEIKTVIEVCVGLHCSMKGSYALLESIRAHYDLKIGIPSYDGMLLKEVEIPSYDGMLLKEVECMHNCNNAISVLINGIECNDSSFGSVIKYIEAVHVKVR